MWQQDVAKSALEGAWVVHWLQSIGNEEVLRLLHRSFWCWGRVGCLPGNLASWALAAFPIACRYDFGGGRGLPIPYGIRIAIGVSVSTPYRGCIVNRNSISAFRPGISQQNHSAIIP